MKKSILILSVIFLFAFLAFAAGPPVKGARHLGTFSSGLIYSFTSQAGNGVTVDFCGYNNNTIDLMITAPAGDPVYLAHDQYLYKTGAYWEWIVPTSDGSETLYMYPEAGNVLDVWINP